MAALAAGLSYAEAAAVVGCSARTVSRRMADPELRQAVDDARDASLRRAASALADAAPAAAHQLARLAAEAEQERTRLAACRSVLDVAPKLREAVELDERLAALEAAVGATTPAPLRLAPA